MYVYRNRRRIVRIPRGAYEPARSRKYVQGGGGGVGGGGPRVHVLAAGAKCAASFITGVRDPNRAGSCVRRRHEHMNREYSRRGSTYKRRRAATPSSLL